MMKCVYGVTEMLDYVKYRVFRNNYGLKDSPSQKHRVNLEYSKINNVGDSLSPVIINWMLKKRGISIDKTVKKTKHLMAVGSIVGRGRFDSTIWGSGILKDDVEPRLIKQAFYKKYDIRAVRGPITRKALMHAGYNCPEIYGDPAILMPLIYSPKVERKYNCSIILHHRTVLSDKTSEEQYAFSVPSNINIIDPSTTDYKSFINSILASDFIISSSLHGIIISESYGIPSIFFNFGVKDQEIKFADWYSSTGRDLAYCSTIEEAFNRNSQKVPDLKKMQLQLIESFPYDLWD